MDGKSTRKSAFLHAMGARLRLRREGRGLTQEAVGKNVGMSKDTIARYERGEVSPGADALMLLCVELDASADWILTGEGHPERERPDDQAATYRVGTATDERAHAREEAPAGYAAPADSGLDWAALAAVLGDLHAQVPLPLEPPRLAEALRLLYLIRTGRLTGLEAQSVLRLIGP